jgi:hypothetical protein
MLQGNPVLRRTRHFDPTNAALEAKDRENYAKTAFFAHDQLIQGSMPLYAQTPDLNLQWVQHVACRNSGSKSDS